MVLGLSPPLYWLVHTISPSTVFHDDLMSISKLIDMQCLLFVPTTTVDKQALEHADPVSLLSDIIVTLGTLPPVVSFKRKLNAGGYPLENHWTPSSPFQAPRPSFGKQVESQRWPCNRSFERGYCVLFRQSLVRKKSTSALHSADRPIL